MKRVLVFSLTPLLPCLIWGCSETEREAGASDTAPAWDDQQEVIHQLREVIRYEDERERLRQQALRELDLPVDVITPTEPVVPAGEGQDQTQH